MQRRVAVGPNQKNGVVAGAGAIGAVAAAVAVLVLVARGGAIAESAPFTAQAGVELAQAAAHAWAEDARLIYVENDEDLAGTGAAARWGYLYYSKTLRRARSYTIRNGEVAGATDLGFEFDAPPLEDTWIDSGPALASADKEVGAEFCTKEGGQLAAMLLVRGVLYHEEPDATTWAVVYSAPNAPALYVVVDARSNKVVRTWRG